MTVGTPRLRIGKFVQNVCNFLVENCSRLVDKCDP